MDRHHVQPVSTTRNVTTIVFIVLTNSFGNLLLAIGAGQLPGFHALSFPEYLQKLFTNAGLLSGTALLALWMIAQLSMLSWSDLTYVVPVTAGGYIVTALLGIFILGETVSLSHWIGIVLICAGVIAVAETAPRTIHETGAKHE